LAERVGTRERLTLTTSDGVTLEAELRMPPAPTRTGVAFAHPHPEHGGTMASILVPRAGDALVEAGYAFLRWNFRGTGRSGGAHGEGKAEPQDVRAAADLLRARGVERLVLAGLSFGADMSMCAAPEVPGVLGVVAVVPPIWYLDEAHWRRLAAWGRPVRFVLAEDDVIRAKEQVVELAARLPDAAFTVVPGADHLFSQHRAEALAAIVACVGELAAAPEPHEEQP
jgi:alpha/beta superfamily hydrolase